jgi:RNA polymerase sigma-70 factor (ECF subfamily)
MHTFRGEAQLFTWVCSICRNQIIDWQRKNKIQREHIILVEDFPDLNAVVDSFHAPASDDPCEITQRGEFIRLIQVVLDRLPIKYGNVLEWRYIEGYSADEVSERLHISLEATNSLTARAKRAFAELYSPLAQAAHAPLPGGAQ